MTKTIDIIIEKYSYQPNVKKIKKSFKHLSPFLLGKINNNNVYIIIKKYKSIIFRYTS